VKRRFAISALIGASLLAGCGDSARISDPTRSAGAAAFDKGGNSDAAHACQQGGWQHLEGSDGTLFHNTGECVSFAAHGGTLVPIPQAPVITSFTFDGLDPNGNPIFTAVFTGASFGILNTDGCGPAIGIISGVPTTYPGLFPTTYVLTVTNQFGSATAAVSFSNVACA